jgi:hypothetical protein
MVKEIEWRLINGKGEMDKPLFGLTQYCFGAVVLTLNAIGWAESFPTIKDWVTTPVVNGLRNCSSFGGERVIILDGWKRQRRSSREND